MAMAPLVRCGAATAQDVGMTGVRSGAATTEEVLQVVAEVFSALREVLALKDIKVHDDIRRGKTIISDAVVKLGNSFNGLNTQTRTQQQLVASLMDEVS